MKFFLPSLFLVKIVTKNYWTWQLSNEMKLRFQMQMKLRFHTIECFLIQLFNDCYSRDSTSSPFGACLDHN